MAFSWRRIRKHLAGGRLRDTGDGSSALARFDFAPQYAVALPYRLCPHSWNDQWGASALGYLRILRRLLLRGADPDARDFAGKTALHYAIESGQSGALDALLAAGASPDVGDETGRTAVHFAAARGDFALLRRLIDAGGSIDAGARDSHTPLIEALRAGRARTALALLDAGADPRTPDRFGFPALFYVDGRTAPLVLSALRDAGASLKDPAASGDLPIHHVLRLGDPSLFDALCPPDDLPELALLRGRTRDTTLHAAAEGGAAELLARLVAYGVAIDAANALGHTALLVALTQEELPAATWLRRAGASVGFLEAVALGDAEKASGLPLSADIHLDAPIAGHETPLMGAVARGRADLVELLLSRGASPDAGTESLGTPLDVAAMTGNDALVRLLLSRGADPARARHVRPAELKRRARLAPIDEPLPAELPLAGRRAEVDDIYAAAVTGADDDLRWLRLTGAEIDATDADGLTALMQAAQDGDAPAIRRLLAFGADPARRAHDNRTARDLARTDAVRDALDDR